MKKVLFTAFAALAFAFTMTACGGNNNTEATDENATEAVATEQVEHQCAMEATEHECQCGEECKAANCEGCTNHGTENCCKAKAAVEGQACEQTCEHKCQKAEGQECQKACEKKCEKAQ